MRKTLKAPLFKRMKSYWEVYVMIIPVVAFYLLFCYYPMYGILIAFKDYLPSQGILGSEWIGLEHFRWIFAEPGFMRAFRNTLVISGLKLLLCFPFPILLSLLLNELVFAKLKKAVQTAIYLPYFISWVVIAGIVYSLCAVNGGTINNILALMGIKRVNFMTNPAWFYPILILAEIWKNAGWGTVIYISAISGINPELYEAAKVDGCKRFGRMWYITLPSIAPIIMVMFILQIGNIMNAGFDPIFNLYNPAVVDVADILDTFAYTIGIDKGLVEKGAALGLFKTVINFALLLAADTIVRKVNGSGLYD